MTITRRKLMAGTAALAVASLPITTRSADPEEGELLAVFRQMSDKNRALMHNLMRRLAGLPYDPQLTARSECEESKE